MRHRRIAGMLGVLLALAAGVLVWWGRPPSGPIIGTLDPGSWISTLILAPAEGHAFALSPTDGRMFVLDVRTAALERVLTVPLPRGAPSTPSVSIAPEIVDGQVFLTDAMPRQGPRHVYAAAEGGRAGASSQRSRPVRRARTSPSKRLPIVCSCSPMPRQRGVWASTTR